MLCSNGAHMDVEHAVVCHTCDAVARVAVCASLQRLVGDMQATAVARILPDVLPILLHPSLLACCCRCCSWQLTRCGPTLWRSRWT
jgi:hypothetical protein